MNDEPPLIAVSVKSSKRSVYPTMPGGYAQTAVIVGQSDNREAAFEFQTGLLNSKTMAKCVQLQQHGFTAVEAPENWLYAYLNEPGGWQHAIVILAMDRVAAIYANQESGTVMGYNAELAERVLVELDKAFPNPVQTIQLKDALAPEPSDDELLTALDALHLRGMIDGKPLRGSTTATRTLVAMANIQITANGHDHVHGTTQPILPNIVIQGDQINNHGQVVGAIGRNSTGTINYQQQWAGVASQVELSQVATELQALRTELMKTANAPADFQQLGLVAEAEQYAEKQDGTKVMEVLSKVGRELFDFAKDVGAEVTAKVIAKATGLEP